MEKEIENITIQIVARDNFAISEDDNFIETIIEIGQLQIQCMTHAKQIVEARIAAIDTIFFTALMTTR